VFSRHFAPEYVSFHDSVENCGVFTLLPSCIRLCPRVRSGFCVAERVLTVCFSRSGPELAFFGSRSYPPRQAALPISTGVTRGLGRASFGWQLPWQVHLGTIFRQLPLRASYFGDVNSVLLCSSAYNPTSHANEGLVLPVSGKRGRYRMSSFPFREVVTSLVFSPSFELFWTPPALTRTRQHPDALGSGARTGRSDRGFLRGTAVSDARDVFAFLSPLQPSASASPPQIYPPPPKSRLFSPNVPVTRVARDSGA